MAIQFSIYNWILLTGFGICFIICSFHFFRILLLGMPKDYSHPLGDFSSGLKYSFTGAMSPFKKETAYLHLPTYTAGIFFHLGTFLSFCLLLLHFFYFPIPVWLISIFTIILIISSISGFSILIKRILKPVMRGISNPDDYLSNLLVTGFQIFSIVGLVEDSFLPYLFIYSTILFLYLPLGKLRHVVYFFTSRIHLAFFYGRRGVWPPKRIKS